MRQFGRPLAGQEYQERPGAYALAVRGDVLLVVEAPGGLYLPGGGIDHREPPEEALRRELREETGHVVASLRPFATARQRVGPVDGHVFVNKLERFFLCEVREAEGTAAEAEHQPQWIPLSRAARELREEAQRWAVRQALDRLGLATVEEPPEARVTLPDLLAPGLEVVFVGINPSLYAVRAGHYFARSTNRFWPAFSRSQLSEPVRAGLGREVLVPADDLELPGFGFGFTDVVKRPTGNASQLRPEEYEAGVPRLIERLAANPARVACFHGVTGFRPVLRFGFGQPRPHPALGLQPERLGDTAIFLVPNPSPANAHFRLDDQTAWYDELAGWLAVQSSQAARRISS